MQRDEMLRGAAKLLADPDAAASFAAGLDKASRAALVAALGEHVSVGDLRGLAARLPTKKKLDQMHQVAIDEQRARRPRRVAKRRRRNPRHVEPLYDTEPLHVCCTHEDATVDLECACCQGECAFHLSPTPPAPMMPPSLQAQIMGGLPADLGQQLRSAVAAAGMGAVAGHLIRRFLPGVLPSPSAFPGLMGGTPDEPDAQT
jgi:hypothetical protein